jgi:YD repeat-containing protein
MPGTGTATTFTFDQRGNRTKATTGTAVTTYDYDQANRLTSYTSGSATATYTYNGDGLRVAKTVGGSTSTFGYDIAEGLPLLLSDGSNSYICGPDRRPGRADRLEYRHVPARRPASDC